MGLVFQKRKGEAVAQWREGESATGACASEEEGRGRDSVEGM
jgi:hypothetical protein